MERVDQEHTKQFPGKPKDESGMCGTLKIMVMTTMRPTITEFKSYLLQSHIASPGNLLNRNVPMRD